MDEIDKLGVVTAYNLSSRNQKVSIQIDLIKSRLDVTKADIFNGVNQKITTIRLIKKSESISQFEIDIPPLSPIIVILQK